VRRALPQPRTRPGGRRGTGAVADREEHERAAALLAACADHMLGCGPAPTMARMRVREIEGSGLRVIHGEHAREVDGERTPHWLD